MQSLLSVQEQKEALLQQIKERQDRVRAILESAPLQKGQQDFRYDSAGMPCQQERVPGINSQKLRQDANVVMVYQPIGGLLLLLAFFPDRKAC